LYPLVGFVLGSRHHALSQCDTFMQQASTEEKGFALWAAFENTFYFC
jgi:hypothetical protein